MEFDFTVPGLTAQHITVWDAAALKRLGQEDLDKFKKILDTFGKRSAKAQGLGAAITDIYRLRATDQRLYIAATRHNGGTVLLGGLKTGSKKLFVRTVTGALQEVEPQCVLDFYVHEDYQRKGVGKQLFEFFLSHERQHPGGVAYDRPSNKLLAFISRHYGLHDYQPQNNNFVLFDEYWRLNPDDGGNNKAGTRRGSAVPAQAVHPVAPSAMPAWMSGLPPSNRPQMNPSTPTLTSPSCTGSPAVTLTAPMEPRTIHPSPLQIESSSAYSYPYGPSLANQYSAQPAHLYGGFAEQYAPSSNQRHYQHHSPQSAAAQPPMDRQPSFGRRGPPPPPGYLDASEQSGAMGGSQQIQSHMHPTRGDALDDFYRMGARGGTSPSQPLSPVGPSGHTGGWQGAVGGGDNAGGGSSWPAPSGSIHTPQGPAYLYSPMPMPGAGAGLGCGPLPGAGAGLGYGGSGATDRVNSGHGGKGSGGYPPVGSAPQLVNIGYDSKAAAHGDRVRTGGPGGAPRYSIPPWGVDEALAGPVQVITGTRGARSTAQYAPQGTPQQQQQQRGGAPTRYGAVGALVPPQVAALASPAELSSGSFGKGGMSGGGVKGIMSARDAALAARAGSGAAGCLVW